MSEVNEIEDISAPRWMSKAEKRSFEEIKRQRNSAGKPLLQSEVDLLSDYISARSRIAALRKILKKELADVGGSLVDQRNIAMLTRQVDSTTGLARRLWKQLEHGGQA